MALAYEEYYTIKDYERWEGDWELIYGQPYAMAPFALPRHQLVSSKIVTQLNNLLEECSRCKGIMESEIVISSDTILRPDVIVYCDEIKDRLTKTPPIIFEVASPSTLKRDELIKKEIYEREGVKYYIIVYLEEDRAKVYENVNGRFLKIADESKKIKFKFDCEIEFDFNKIW
jgi:Uma2 family endonuclease